MELADCHPLARKIALARAGGDKSRLRAADDGGVLVLNPAPAEPGEAPKSSRRRSSAR